MRRVKHILCYVLVLSMCFTLFFFPSSTVFADNPTYTEVTAGTCVDFVGNYWRYIGVNSDVRGIKIDDYVYFISLNTFSTSYDHDACSISYVSTAYAKSFTDSTIFYYHSEQSSSFSEYPSFSSSDYPQFSNREFVAYYLTFGNGAVDPSPTPVVPTYGKPYDVEYSTRIAGSGLASADNIDRIVWNRAVDTNGNELPTGARVQIRAIPGKYIGNTANDVLTKTYTDFVLDHSKQLIIVDIIASRGVYETKWSEVVEHFGFFPYSWVPNIQYIDNEYFKMGWIYQIRLQVDDYYSDWTNIYTATGSGASESQTITDSDEISQQLVQDINIVNQLNNTTTTNWYINETTINNSEYTENTNGKPWWAYLLEAILSLFQIGDGEQQTINNTNNLNIDLNDKLDEYNQIEDQQLQNLDTNLEAIEVQSDMLEDNKFIGSANWVATQYNRMTNGTVIGSLIGFSLLFGLALIFIGKIR